MGRLGEALSGRGVVVEAAVVVVVRRLKVVRAALATSSLSTTTSLTSSACPRAADPRSRPPRKTRVARQSSRYPAACPALLVAYAVFPRRASCRPGTPSLPRSSGRTHARLPSTTAFRRLQTSPFSPTAGRARRPLIRPKGRTAHPLARVIGRLRRANPQPLIESSAHQHARLGPRVDALIGGASLLPAVAPLAVVERACGCSPGCP